MATKLTEITTQYHTFVDDQVLTKDQLNEFISYFEDQDRLSRVFLHGVGTVCGFNLKLNPAKSSITISQGVGLTTDGDLLKLRKDIAGKPFKTIDLKEVEYSWVKKYEDNFANYRFFKRLQTIDGKVQEVPLELWEILPDKVENSNPLNTLANLNDKVLVLYLETFAKQGDLCTTVDCDNQGVEQVARLRVLLASKKDAEYILGLDSIFSKHNIIDSYFSLPDVAVSRVVLNQLNTANYNELKRAYFDALNNNNLITEMSYGISKIIKDFEPILKLNISASLLNTYLGNLKNIISFSAYSVPFNVQYRYDCIKDIVDTYNEIKTLLLSLKEECCPDIKAFPKHLMLGSIGEIQEEIKHYRHEFYKSPVLNRINDTIIQCRSLVFRLFSLVSNFLTSVGETRITPSNKIPEKLGLKSIPFYYKIQDDFLKEWNFEKTGKYKSNTNLSYHINSLSSAPHIQEPLAYNTDRFDFYRIEGHQGKDYIKVMEEIDSLKIKYGLAFDVKALSVNINSKNLNIDDYECEFEDLNVLLRAWSAEQDCVLAQVSQFFSGFSIKEPGTNLKKNTFDVAKVAVAAESPQRAIINDVSKSRTAIFEAADIKKEAQGNTAFVYSQPLTFTKNNVISENLTLSEDALGNVMKIAFDETKGGSVNDIIAKAGKMVNEKIDAETWNSQPEVKALVLDKSIELMSYSHVLSQKMPGILADVNLVNVATYKLTLKELCDKVETLKTEYQSVELSENLKTLMGILITQLSSICCSAKKLEILLEEINKRKENILLRLQLSKFVEKHPGLEHKAGVVPGGTFILVYLNKTESQTKETETEKATFEKFNPTIDLKTTSSITSSKTATTPNVFEIADVSKSKLNVLEKEISFSLKDSLLTDRLDIFSRFVKQTDLPNNTIVADFSLPYMCCSECAPVNFIIQKSPVSLRLERDHYCLGKDIGPLLFEVSPADGVIKADPEITGMTIEGNKLSFDPELFADEMLGRTVRFTVNDQVTQTEITVYRMVEFDFKVPESPTSLSEITFVPTGNLDGSTFLWNFGDDSLSEARNTTHKYNLPVNEENKVTVSLTVTAPNGICQNTVEHGIIFETEKPSIDIDGRDFCSNNRNSIPFIIKPEGAKVEISGTGVEKNANGEFVFVPAKADIGDIEFKLNDEASGLKVTVHQAPVAVFTPAQVDNQLILTNNSTGAKSYVWSINGEKLERDDNEPFIIELTPNSPNEWELMLLAVSEFCGTAKSPKITFTTKIDEEPSRNCVEETKAAILVDQRVLSRLNMPDSNIVNPIWLQTSQVYGGTAQFNKGVINDIDNFLSGKNNGKLLQLFEKLLNETATMILELSGEPSSEEFKRLVELFRLQLQLFYNILGCQDAEMIKASGNFLQPIFSLILELIKMLKDQKVKLSAALRDFLKNYLVKVAEVPDLEKHISLLIENLA